MFDSKIPSIENYLAQIARELRDLPASARAEEMREIEAHLDALVQAGQQLEEISQTEATTTALRQFGAPRQIGKNLRRAWERKQSEPWWCAAGAAMFAVDFFVMLVHPVVLGFTNFHAGAQGVRMQAYESVLLNPQMFAAAQSMAPVMQFLSAFSTLFVACIMGLLSPKRGKEVLALLLVLGFGGLLSDPDNLTVFAGTLMLNTVICAIIGAHFGAIHGRRWLSRRADARENADANQLIS